jgi:methylenetetrahydrofolate reductase (NADPH)
VTTVTEANSRLAQALRTERLIVTAESRPPLGAGGTVMASLPASVCALVVPDNHEEIRASALSCALQLLRQGIEPVLTLVTRDRNRIALQSDVLGAAALGVTNCFCVSGHHQSLGVAPAAASAFDIDPIQLLQSLAAMRDDGVLLGGERVDPPPVLFLGAAAHPFLQPMALNLIQTKKKVASGAQFLLTQPIWDVDGFAQWMTAVRDLGLCGKTHILATVGPLSSAGQAEAIRKQHPSAIPESVVDRMRKAADPAREGVAICAEMAARVKDIEGIRGIHVLSGDREETLTPILEQAGLARA